MTDVFALAGTKALSILRGNGSISALPSLGGLGNSWIERGFTTQAFGAKNPVVHAASLLRGRVTLSPADIFGYSSQNSNVVVATGLPLAVASTVSYIFIEAFINDLPSGMTVAQSVANLKIMLDALIAAGKCPLVQTIPPRGDGVNSAALRGYNARVNAAIWEEYYKRPRGAMYVVDTASRLTSRASSVGAQISGVYDVDNVHLIDFGASLVAQGIFDVLDRILPPASRFNAWPGNLFSRTDNPVGVSTNAWMSGTGGTVTSPMAGVAPNNHGLSRTSGSRLIATGSKIAGTNGGEFFQVAFSSTDTAGANSEQVELAINFASTFKAGDKIVGFVDSYGVGLSNVLSCYSYVAGATTGVWNGMSNSGVTGDALPSSFDRVAFTPVVTVAADEAITFKAVMNARCNGVTPSGNIVIRQAGILVLSAVA